jgi:hypothetical protein
MATGQTLTILRLVQRVLSALNLVSISTLNETEEDAQVLEIINRMYEELLSEFPWAHQYEYVNLLTTTTAHIMAVPERVVNFNWIKYNDKDVSYVTPKFMNDFHESGILTDRDPQYWTTLDDTNIIFSSYNSNLVSSLSTMFAQTVPLDEFSADADVTNLPRNMNNLLLNMVLEIAAEEINGDSTASGIYAQKVRRLRQLAKRWARRHNVKPTTFGPDYARRRHTSFSHSISSNRIVENP